VRDGLQSMRLAVYRKVVEIWGAPQVTRAGCCPPATA
jgi:hypothetical protein